MNIENFGNKRMEAKKTNDWLSFYKKNITSQHGEDGIIEKIFEIIPICNKWCVEFGAGDGVEFSNTYNLITNKSWSAVLIEADRKKYEKLHLRYKDSDKAATFNTVVNFEGPHTIDNLLAKTSIPKSFDLLSIDVDGNDYHIWDSICTYKPKVVLIEFNPSIPLDIEFIQPKNMSVYQGSSLLSLVRLGKNGGYELIAATDSNAFFVEKGYFGLFGIEDNAPSSIRKIDKYEARLFQLYDGTLVLSGCDHLLWHGIKISQAKMQVLPRFLRVYPSAMSTIRLTLATYGHKVYRFLDRINKKRKSMERY